MARKQQRQIGPYRIDKKLGQGGMGAVYLAFKDEQPVALKVLAGALAEDTDFVDRFRREATLTAQLDHPNLVRLLDFGEDDRAGLYLVMEYVEGETLRDRLEQHGPFPADQALGMFRQVASALEFAHQRNIVHRDLKPENLLLDKQGRIVVADFGVARNPTATRLTRTGIMPGTPEYMSPEQFDNKPLGPASDIYSLGLVLYEMLTGTTPFRSENLAETIQRQCFQPPAPPSFHAPSLAPGVDRVVLKALEKRPENRYPSAAAFEEAVAAALQEGTARPERRSGAVAVEPRMSSEATVLVSRAAPGAGSSRVGWLMPLVLLLALAGTGWWALSRRLSPPLWYAEGVGAEPAPSQGVLFGAVTLQGTEVALLGPSRQLTGLQLALACADRLSAELRAGTITDPDQLLGRKAKNDYEIYLRKPERVVLLVNQDDARALGLKAEPVGAWWLALLRDQIGLRQGKKPRATADYERDHPLRPDQGLPVSPLLDRIYDRGRLKVREGPLPTEALLEALDSLPTGDRNRVVRAPREVPREIPKRPS